MKKLIDLILSDDNFNKAIERVKENKGASGIDKMKTDELDEYLAKHMHEIKADIREMRYKPLPVRRVYIPKTNGKLRPLGIPTVVDRVVQQAIAQVFSEIYDESFSECSYGFRPNRSAHGATRKVLEYLNEGYTWVIDLDIEKYFDTVNHDKLISILREKVNDKTTLHLIRSFLRAGVMERGLFSSTEVGVPQGGPLSPILSNVYLDKFDKELEERGLKFVRYADDCNIFVKSEMSANRVMVSVTKWLEKKLFLKVSATKTKIVRPTDSNFLGFTFWNDKGCWKCKVSDDRKAKLYAKLKPILLRKSASARRLSNVFVEVNQIVVGWINYYRIGSMKRFMKEFGGWLRHKIRVIIIKQWKRPRTIYTNLQRINKAFNCRFSDEEIYAAANTRLGLYKQCCMETVNFILSPKVLAIKKGDRPGLVNPLKYYLEKQL